ncbi:MAG: LLM class flavin-dependent oxidoreductase [Motilibacteraceae bacterium]
MKFSLRLNNDLDVATLTAIAQRAEAHGFDQLWISNDLLLRSAPALVSVLAARTSRLRLGIGILNPYSIHPTEIAMLAATLQEISDGRFLLGVGAGSAEFLGWAGLERPRPLSRTAEAVRVVRALLGGDVDAADLPPWWGAEAHLRFPAAAAPIYVGGMSPRMLEMAGGTADGVLALLYPPEHFSEAREQILRGAKSAGRDPESLDIPACVWVSVHSDRDAARHALAEKLAYYGPSFAPYLLERAGLTVEDFAPITAELTSRGLAAAAELVDERMLALGIAGDVDEVVARCRRLQGMGAEHLSFGPPLGPDVLEAVDLLGRQVLPALRG